jgi:hypothetical protein
MAKRDKRLVGVCRIGVFNIQIGVFRSLADCAGHLARVGCRIEAESKHSIGMARWDECENGTTWWSLIITDEATDATIVHECVHMADFIMERVGIPTGVENTEIRALLTAEVYLEACRVLGR